MSTRRKPPSTGQPSATTLTWLFDAGLVAALILVTFAVYAQVTHFEFISVDDGAYVYANPNVQAGITPGTIWWALTASVTGNWAPVTMLSHALAVELFGMESGMHHLVNVLIHILAAILLFGVFKRATGARWRSAFVAFVFALHPLHVESVAWVAERKDVLSALFFFLALYLYVLYAERPGLGRYLMLMAAFSLGLMSKATLVTFPFVLLLFDVWPLRRVQFPKIFMGESPAPRTFRRSLYRDLFQPEIGQRPPGDAAS